MLPAVELVGSPGISAARWPLPALPLPPPMVPSGYPCSCGWGRTRFRLSLTLQKHCFCLEGCGEVELERAITVSPISSACCCSCIHTATGSSKVLILSNLIWEHKFFPMDCNNFSYGHVLCFIFKRWVYLVDHNGSSSQTVLFYIFVGFFFHVMHTLCSYNGTLVNLMDDAQRRSFSV